MEDAVEGFDNLGFIDDEELDPKVERTLEDLQDVSWGVIEKILQDRTYEPTLNEAKVVLTYLATESTTETNSPAARNECKPISKLIHSEVDLNLLKRKVPSETPLYFGNIARDDDQDSNAAIFYGELREAGFFERLNLETSDSLAVFLAQHLDTYEPAVIQDMTESGAFTFTYTLLHDLHISSSASNRVAELCLEYVDRLQKDPTKNKLWTVYNYYLDEFTDWGRRRLFSPTDLDRENPNFKAEIYLYIIENGLPHALNMVRSDM